MLTTCSRWWTKKTKKIPLQSLAAATSCLFNFPTSLLMFYFSDLFCRGAQHFHELVQFNPLPLTGHFIASRLDLTISQKILKLRPSHETLFILENVLYTNVSDVYLDLIRKDRCTKELYSVPIYSNEIDKILDNSNNANSESLRRWKLTLIFLEVSNLFIRTYLQ